MRDIVTAEVKKQGLSGYRLSKLSGLPMRTVQGYLAGEADIRGERLLLILNALDLEIRPKATTASTKTKER